MTYAVIAVERAMKLQDVILRAMSGELSWLQAADILGMYPRSLRRWRARQQRVGYDGLLDRRRQRPSPRLAPFAEVERILRLYREHDRGFNVRHFHQLGRREHGVTRSYSFVKTALQKAGLVATRRVRGRHRRRREPRACFGELRAGPRPDRLDNREAGVDSPYTVSRPYLQEAQVPLVRVYGQPFEALVGRTDRRGPSCLRGPPWFPKAMRGRSAQSVGLARTSSAPETNRARASGASYWKKRREEESPMNSERLDVETVQANGAERLRAIRLRLPGQAVKERVETARAAYGPLYTMGLVRERVAETLPTKIGYVRSTMIDPIEEYRGLIPDEALLKYDDAAQSGLFSKFWVVTPTYYWKRQIDPWMLAEVTGTKLCALITRWDDQDGENQGERADHPGRPQP